MIIGSIISGIMGSKAAKKQGQAADRAMEIERQNFLDGLKLIKPSIQSGDRARSALEFELLGGQRPFFTPGDDAPAADAARPAGAGLTVTPGGMQVPTSDLDSPLGPDFNLGSFVRSHGTSGLPQNVLDYMDANWRTPGTTTGTAPGGAAQAAAPQGFRYRGFQETPGYQYMVDEGQKALERSAAARGMLMSGNTTQELQRHRMGLANQTYGEFLNRLSGLSGAGQVASTTAFQGQQALGGALSGLTQAKGNAQASSHIAIGNAANSAIGNIANVFGFLGGGFG